MGDVSAVRAALATQLATITGLRSTAFMPDKVSVPQAVVGDVDITFDKTMGRGHDQLDIKIRVYASRASDRAGQLTLDGYLKGSGATSIKAALEAGRGAPGSPALGGAAEDLIVTGVSGYGVYTVADVQYLGAEFAVTVYTRGT